VIGTSFYEYPTFAASWRTPTGADRPNIVDEMEYKEGGEQLWRRRCAAEEERRNAGEIGRRRRKAREERSKMRRGCKRRRTGQVAAGRAVGCFDVVIMNFVS